MVPQYQDHLQSQLSLETLERNALLSLLSRRLPDEMQRISLLLLHVMPHRHTISAFITTITTAILLL